MSSPFDPGGPLSPFGSLVDISVEEPEYVPGPLRVTTSSQTSPPCWTVHVPTRSLGCAEFVVDAGPEVIVPDFGWLTVDELVALFFVQAVQTSRLRIMRMIIFIFYS